MKCERARVVSLFLALLGTGFWPLYASDQSVDTAKRTAISGEREAWEGKFADGRRLTRKKLDEMLTAHLEWLKTSDEKIRREQTKANVKEEDEETWREKLLASDWGADQGRLVLKGANLEDAHLKANLAEANLQGARLSNSNLRDAILFRTNLQGVVLWEPDLQAIFLHETNLQGAHLWVAKLQAATLNKVNLQAAILYSANLQEASIVETNLQDANLVGANLQGATLFKANLQDANLVGANLYGVIYEPKLGALPNIVMLRNARHLETLRFRDSPHGLEELKEAFKKAGMHQQEREIIHAIKRSEQANAWREGDFLESTFNWVFFDLPVGYGLYPGRALKILGALIPVFALLYGFAIGRSTGNPGIYRIQPKERIEVTHSGAGMADDPTIELLQAKGWRIIPHALYFSLLSTFHIGWRELNVGNWISRLQLHPYTLEGTGWLRTVSGIQSLISVYLLAMWVLSYFGRPFE